MDSKITKRHTGFDLLRIIGFFMVIAIHTRDYVYDFPSEIGIEWFVSSAVWTFLKTSNGMLFMLSGYFIIDKAAKESVLIFYKKRFSKVLMPFLFMNVVLYLYWALVGDIVLSWNTPIDFLMSVVTNNVTAIYWFFHMIIGFYLIAPFLGRMFECLSDRELRTLMTILIMYNLLYTTVDRTNYSFSYYNPNSAIGLSGWLLFFIMGYAIKRLIKNCSISKSVLVGGFSIAIAMSLCVKYFLPDKGYIDDSNFAMLLACSCLFIIFRDYCNVKSNKVMVSLANAGFTVYMVHRLWIDAIGRYLHPIILNTGIPNSLAIIFTYCMISMVSIITALLLDRLIFNKIYNWLLNASRRKESNS